MSLFSFCLSFLACPLTLLAFLSVCLLHCVSIRCIVCLSVSLSACSHLYEFVCLSLCPVVSLSCSLCFVFNQINLNFQSFYISVLLVVHHILTYRTNHVIYFCIMPSFMKSITHFQSNALHSSTQIWSR